MALSEKANYLLREMSAGKALCFSQDGDCAWLYPGGDILSRTYDEAIQELMKPKLIACDPDPTHWTEANHFEITDAGLSSCRGIFDHWHRPNSR